MTDTPIAAAPPRIVVATVALEGWSAALEAGIVGMLSADERGRAARIRAEPQRQQFIAAHALKRRMLQDIGGRPAHDWTFATGAHGKPFVVSGRGQEEGNAAPLRSPLDGLHLSPNPPDARPSPLWRGEGGEGRDKLTGRVLAKTPTSLRPSPLAPLHKGEGKSASLDGHGVQDAGPYFNLSHCDGLVACAVSLTLPLGLDVERIDREGAAEVAARFFAPTERAWLAGLPAGAKGEGFFRLWTAKEAFAKATGRGIMQDFREFAVAFDPPRILFAEDDATAPGLWRLHPATVGAHHALALCWNGPQAEVTLRTTAPEAVADG